VKTTAHFEDAIAVRRIARKWCERVVNHPLQMEVQQNGRIRYWGLIEEVDKYLRVVLLDDFETYHTACFDRNFGKKAKR
jgi:small nuclear ribonucleoprotein (snRNP)-like protein